MTENQDDNRLTIRGMTATSQLWRDTKANAARQGKTLPQYVSEALIYFNAQNEAAKKT